MSSPIAQPISIPPDQFSLEDQLATLHERPEDSYGDVLFVMPNNNKHASPRLTIPLPSRIWAHSALLAVTYSKPLSRLGDIYSSLTYAEGYYVDTLPQRSPCNLPYTIVVVSPENDLVVRKLVAGCYRPVVIRNLWEKMGGKREMLLALDEGVLLACNSVKPHDTGIVDGDILTMGTMDDGDRDESVGSWTTRDNLFQGDVTLKIEGGSVSFSMHKFLLDLRVPYFRTMFRSAFSEASMNEHTLSSEYFTPLSLAIVVQYLYFDDAELLFSWKWTDFARYLNSTKCSSDINAPSQDIFDIFIDALVSAKFLQLESLEWWITNCLIKIAHGFACNGAQCARFLPAIAVMGYQNNIADLYRPCISWLAKHSNISFLWKRNMLSLPEELKADLVDTVKARLTVSNVIPLYLRLYNLRQNTATSVFKDDWEQSLVGPLLEYCAEFVSYHFAEPRIVFSAARGIHHKPPSTTYNAIEDLFSLVLANLNKFNAAPIWRGADCYTKLVASAAIVEQLNQAVISWFAQNWRDLVVMQSSSGHPLSGSRTGFVTFNEWPDESLQKLSMQIKVPLSDLKGLGATARSFELRKEKWLEKCRIMEMNRLMRRQECLKVRDEDSAQFSSIVDTHVDYQ
ncbi:hypothetical protein V1525DRAFT_394499 [Lipomyces kononenkoae]|uniref:Uncharacterized protein n=1 Tax=Lipomyces kononenkoae TaxID=34357 RepID=A0ACC3TAJ1_LIPKO